MFYFLFGQNVLLNPKWTSHNLSLKKKRKKKTLFAIESYISATAQNLATSHVLKCSPSPSKHEVEISASLFTPVHSPL